jgi:hypothetical protein
MRIKPKESSDQTNSEKTSDEGKSEEFLNFERAMKGIMGIPPDEAKKIIRKTPYPKSGEEKQEKTESN